MKHCGIGFTSPLILSCWLLVLSQGIGLVIAEEPAEQLEVAGLQAPVEIRVDRWGVGHITAQSETDLFSPKAITPPGTVCFSLNSGEGKPPGPCPRSLAAGSWSVTLEQDSS